MNIRDIPRRWWRFVGPHLGLARELYTLAVDPDDARVHHVLPDVCRLERLLGHEQAFDPHAGGSGLSCPEAVDRAMGELLERYAVYSFRGETVRFASYRQLVDDGQRAVEPFRLYSDAQFKDPECPFNMFTDQSLLHWVPGTSLLSGHRVWVPVQLVSLGYPLAPGEQHIAFSSSSGCAVGDSVAKAVLSALLELIERDAFMLRWYGRLPPPRLSLAAESFAKNRWRAAGLELELFDLTVEGVTPVVAAVCREESGRTCAFLIASAARTDLNAAASKAILEVAQGRPFVKTLALDENVDMCRFDDLEKNVRFYAFHDNLQYVRWFISSKATSTHTSYNASDMSPEVAVRTVIADCRHRGIHPVVIDLTTEDMREEGLTACRVVAPELVPLSVPRWPPLGHARLASLWTHSMRTQSGDEIPAWVPHPFP